MGFLNDLVDFYAAPFAGVWNFISGVTDLIGNGGNGGPTPQVPGALQAPQVSKTALQLRANKAALGTPLQLLDFYIPLTKGSKMP